MSENAQNIAELEPKTDITDKLVEESDGTLKKPSETEMKEMTEGMFPYVNKFLCAILKNNMVKIGFSLENNAESSVFHTAILTDIQSVANLHALLTKVLTAFQQEQMRQMQALQGKVNPNFVEQIKAAQEAQTGKKAN